MQHRKSLRFFRSFFLDSKKLTDDKELFIKTGNAYLVKSVMYAVDVSEWNKQYVEKIVRWFNKSTGSKVDDGNGKRLGEPTALWQHPSNIVELEAEQNITPGIGFLKRNMIGSPRGFIP